MGQWLLTLCIGLVLCLVVVMSITLHWHLSLLLKSGSIIITFRVKAEKWPHIMIITDRERYIFLTV